MERSLAIIESLDGDEQDEYINPEKSPFVLELAYNQLDIFPV